MRQIIFSLVFVFSFGLLIYNLKRILSYIKLGQKENRFNNPSERIKNIFKVAFGQTKLLREPVAGLIHFFIFWGFMVFLIAVVEAIVQGFLPFFSFHFLGPIFSIITLVQDFLGVLVSVSVLYSLFRRFVQKVPRLDVKGHKVDAAFILCMILLVVISMFGQNITFIAINNFNLPENEFRPISYQLATLFSVGRNETTILLNEIFWWLHILTIFTFMNYLPYSKHFHVFTSIPNVYFSKIGNYKFALKKLNLEDENATQFGVADFDHLSWKQILDGYSCTECGRCSSVCPAATTGKKL